MGFQFQSLAPVAPLVSRDLSLTPTQFGALVGLYMLPGVFVAIPAAWVGQWLGSKRGVLLALGLMAAGGFLLTSAGSGGLAGAFPLALAARLVGGVGMALLNVLVTKATADRFSGRESATAMALLLAVWPGGIALALAALGGLAAAASWRVSVAATGVWPVIAFVLIVALYQDTPSPGSGSFGAIRRRMPRPSWRVAGLASAAGWAWTLYNCGLIALVSFGPTILAGRGISLAQAGVVSSFVTWGVMAGTPVGGVVADATRRPGALVAFACLSGGAVIGLAILGSSAFHFLLIGFLIGLPTGPIMAMLGEVLPESERGMGYGILLTWYYLGLGAVPAVAGWMTQAVGTPDVILPLSAGLVLATLIPYRLFRCAGRGAEYPRDGRRR